MGEKRELWPSPGSPRSLAAAEIFHKAEVPIMHAVEEKQPTAAMQQLVQDKSFDSDLPTQQNVSVWAARPQRHDQGCGDGDVTEDVWQRLQKIASPPVMKTSTSLPSLPKPELHNNLLTLNLNQGRRKGSKRGEIF